jgi:outer membrane protein TolC
MIRLVVTLQILIFLTACSTQAATLNWTLSEATANALSNSPTHQASVLEERAISRQVTSQKSYLFPTLSLDGSARWVSEVPSLSLGPPGSPPLTFGDHRSHSIGVGITWQIWDWGAALQAYRSVRDLQRSKAAAVSATRRQTILQVRLCYFAVQAALEQSRLIADSLKLAQAQHRDITRRHQAGVASRSDELSARQEVLSWKRRYRASRGDLAVSIRDLVAAMGLPHDPSLVLPMDSKTASDPPSDVETPGAIVSLDAIDSVSRDLQTRALHPPDPSLPQAVVLDALAESARRQAKAYGASQLPRIQVQARASYDYPNGPVLEDIQQNMVGAQVSMPLFDWGRTRASASASRETAAAHEARRDAALADAQRDWHKARDTLLSLEDQSQLDREVVANARELASLIYASYRSGRASLLEVQSVNLGSLQAQVQSARTQVQILVQRSLLIALSKEETND